MAKFIKVNALEETCLEKLTALRQVELGELDRRLVLEVANLFLSQMNSRLVVALVCLLFFTTGQQLSGSLLFGVYITFNYVSITNLTTNAGYCSEA